MVCIQIQSSLLFSRQIRDALYDLYDVPGASISRLMTPPPNQQYEPDVVIDSGLPSRAVSFRACIYCWYNSHFVPTMMPSIVVAGKASPDLIDSEHRRQMAHCDSRFAFPCKSVRSRSHRIWWSYEIAPLLANVEICVRRSRGGGFVLRASEFVTLVLDALSANANALVADWLGGGRGGLRKVLFRPPP